MREILFKAKRVDNSEWVYGYLWIGNDHAYIIPFNVGIGYDDEEKHIKAFAYEIGKATICQYTGLTDKNGNKIWENDVIQRKDIKALGKVEYIEDSFCLNDVDDGKQYIEGMWNKFEVIGNIFDNSELLEDGA